MTPVQACAEPRLPPARAAPRSRALVEAYPPPCDRRPERDPVRPVLDWLLIGGGVHGTPLALALTARLGWPRDRVRVLDPHPTPLATWSRQTADAWMASVRSSLVHHLALDARRVVFAVGNTERPCSLGWARAPREAGWAVDHFDATFDRDAGPGEAVPDGAWSASGHLVSALGLVPVAVRAAVRCLLLDLTPTVLAVGNPSAEDGPTSLAAVGAVVVTLGHLAAYTIGHLAAYPTDSPLRPSPLMPALGCAEGCGAA